MIRTFVGVAVGASSAIALWSGVAWGQSFDCIVNPSATVKVGSPVSTTLARVDIQRGSRVEKGQVIAELDSGVEAADLALAEERAKSTSEIERARGKEDFAEQEMHRGEALARNQTITQQKFDELRSNLRVAQQERLTAELNKRLAELEFARNQALVQQRVIRSPVTGIVTERFLSPGEYVRQDNQIAVIAVTTPLYVEAYLPVRLWSAIKPGETAQVTMDAPVNRTETATVTVVDQVFDSASGTFGVRLELPNADGSLPAGQRCKLALPATATAE